MGWACENLEALDLCEAGGGGGAWPGGGGGGLCEEGGGGARLREGGGAGLGLAAAVVLNQWMRALGEANISSRIL
jgi:hypothetical protein